MEATNYKTCIKWKPVLDCLPLPAWLALLFHYMAKISILSQCFWFLVEDEFFGDVSEVGGFVGNSNLLSFQNWYFFFRRALLTILD